ncbi:unnamed protein product [Clonostachys rosea f. rosea IK726]|uniref:Proline dehydrogenase n=2 Tax=Bionectria ochroleuca TaxID=29856 RepID=A0A0B7KJL4_BIOOC|nr:unnamed protein product [Clonostachys rosea f. rosea IK726]
MATKMRWQKIGASQRVGHPVRNLNRVNRASNSFISSNKPRVRFTTTGGKAVSANKLPPHALLPDLMLWRSLLIATVSTHRFLLGPALSILSFFSKPRKGLLSLQDNLLLRKIFKGTLYNHFCAGENSQEVKATINNIKHMGFRGVILTYAAEVVVDKTSEEDIANGVVQSKDETTPGTLLEHPQDQGIEEWRKGVLKTVGMIGEGDYLALKFTGAGPAVSSALEAQKPIPEQMIEALEDVCNAAVKRKARILVDAEQHYIQTGIDLVAMELMQKYNRNGQAIVFNTYQAYLKRTPQVLQKDLKEAKTGDFVLGVKLVRGAYINSEPRHLINDNKEETDISYDGIAHRLLRGHYPLEEQVDEPLPRLELFLATHNRASVLKAYELQKAHEKDDLPLTKVQYGQLLGMADGVSCALLQLKQEAIDNGSTISPEAYKCLSWGTLEECSSYLLRRAVENRDAVTRTEEEYHALKKEAIRRLLGNSS